jgi:preprotein translocase subunit Sss1
MDYLTRTAADEQVSEEWSGAVWHVLLGFGLVTAGWIGFLMYLSWKALS